MQVIHEQCAGIDVHKRSVTACRMRVVGRRRQREVRRFGTTTPELLTLLDWLAAWQVKQVAMESTGEYWRPVYNVLEGSFELLLVNAKHVKHVPGRKSDVQDAEWLAELLMHGLLRASFVPARPQRALRDLTRYRSRLVGERSRVLNRVQKVLEDANIKLASVASNVLGASGRAMLEALLAGESDGAVLADLARGRLRAKLAELEKALTGAVTDHHRFLLGQQLQHFDFLSAQIAAVDERIAQHMATMDDAAPPDNQDEASSDESGASPSHDPQAPLTHAEAVALLDTIPGVDRLAAEAMVAEIGLDMRRFPTAKHLAAWGGVAPGQHESAGKRKSTTTRKGNRALRAALSQAAWAAARTKNTYLSAQYRRLAARRGKKRAIVAVGHSILVMTYHILKKRQPYQELGADYFDQHKREQTVKHLLRRLEKLGVEVTPAMPTIVAA